MVFGRHASSFAVAEPLEDGPIGRASERPSGGQREELQKPEGFVCAFPLGQVNDDPRARAGGRDDVHSSPRGFDTDALGCESNVAVCKPVGK